MKIFIYKTLFIIFCIYVLFEFTVANQIRKIESKINYLYSKENIVTVKNKIRKEMRAAIRDDVYLSPEDAELIVKFLEKIENELNSVKSQ